MKTLTPNPKIPRECQPIMVSKVHTSYSINCPNGWRSTNGVERVGPSQAAPSHWFERFEAC